jgi:hypothetical protein
MKLRELITRLRAIEQATPGVDVCFQSASGDGNGYNARALVLLAINQEGVPERCVISVGDPTENPNRYQDFLARRKARDGC